jgi:hypothetical protein
MPLQQFKMFFFDIAGAKTQDENVVCNVSRNTFRPAGIELSTEKIDAFMGYQKTQVKQMVFTASGRYFDTQLIPYTPAHSIDSLNEIPVLIS